MASMDEAVLRAAAGLDPPDLLSLDAVHLATAASLRGLGALCCYDRRLAAAARAAGIEVAQPGVDRGEPQADRALGLQAVRHAADTPS